MILSGILSSPSQRRSFLLASSAVLLLSIIAILAISSFAQNTPVWNVLNSLFISAVASGLFALVSGLYISYFFVDPNDMAAKTTLLPEDIGEALKDVATKAIEYRILRADGQAFSC